MMAPSAPTALEWASDVTGAPDWVVEMAVIFLLFMGDGGGGLHRCRRGGSPGGRRRRPHESRCTRSPAGPSIGGHESICSRVSPKGTVSLNMSVYRPGLWRVT